MRTVTNIIHGKMYEVWIVSAALLIPCALMSSSSSMENGTDDNLMFISSDMECLAQLPIVDLMKIRKAIKMMHAVSVYDANRLSNLTTLQINNQNRSQSDAGLRELPTDETRSIFRYLPRFGASTTESPMAEHFIMASQVHDAMKHNDLM